MAGWSKQQLERVSQDETETVARRAAANRWLASMDAKDDLEQIIGHTDGKAAQAVAVSVTGKVEHSLTVHDAMERMRGNPEAMAEAESLGRKLFDEPSTN